MSQVASTGAPSKRTRWPPSLTGHVFLQGLVDLHCPEAVRILDFPHAAQRLGEIAEAVQGAGTKLAEDWLAKELHRLKHHGPAQVLKTLRALRGKHPELEKLQENVSYLEKRQAQMQYPRYQQQEWPIGSGMVESAHKQVVQSRLKGASMRWAEDHVNTMLALRNAVCNDRWQEAWRERGEYLQQPAAASSTVLPVAGYLDQASRFCSSPGRCCRCGSSAGSQQDCACRSQAAASSLGYSSVEGALLASPQGWLTSCKTLRLTPQPISPQTRNAPSLPVTEVRGKTRAV